MRAEPNEHPGDNQVNGPCPTWAAVPLFLAHPGDKTDEKNAQTLGLYLVARYYHRRTMGLG
jgi:hypothetical protein